MIMFENAMTTAQRSRLAMPELASELTFRVWPTDLDVFRHVNNGRYLSFMDLGRTDLIVRSGLWRAMRAHGWTPIASTILMRCACSTSLGCKRGW